MLPLIRCIYLPIYCTKNWVLLHMDLPLKGSSIHASSVGVSVLRMVSGSAKYSKLFFS